MQYTIDVTDARSDTAVQFFVWPISRIGQGNIVEEEYVTKVGQIGACL